MWAGFRNVSSTLDLILNPKTIEDNGCDMPVNWDPKKPIFHHFSFDPAQAEGDRNAVMHFMDGYCRDTGMWVWAPQEITTVPKVTDSLKYYEESTDWLINYAAANGIPSGNAIMDWTSRGSHPETALKKKFKIHTLVYGQACPDGKTKDKKTGRVEDAILIEPNPESIHESKFAHSSCESLSALGAWALMQYTIFGRVRNINKPLLEPLKATNQSKSIDKELYTREFEDRVTSSYGERFAACLGDQLHQFEVMSKKQFVKEHGFSPDIFDLFLQAAYYMLRFRGMIPSGVDFVPKSLMGQPENVYAEAKKEKSDFQELNSLWTHDLI